MKDVTRILAAVGRGNPRAAEELLPLVYDELRKLAAQRMASERPGQTLQATALVHEAYLRLVDVDEVQQWNGRGHFFAAAAEAMRRILVECARRRARIRHGGGRRRVDLDQLTAESVILSGTGGGGGGSDERAPAEEILAVDEALTHFAAAEPAAAELVKLRYFTGLTIEQAAEAMGISVRTANRHWAYAKAWLFRHLSGPGAE